MKAEENCYACLARLVRQAAELATQEGELRAAAMEEGRRVLDDNFSTSEVTIAIATKFHRIIREVTQNRDPYKAMKEKEIVVSRRISEELGSRYGSDLAELLKFSVMGNAIDFFRPLEEVVDQMRLGVDWAIDDTELLREKLKAARSVLYLADNAGEVFFDLPLLRRMRETAKLIYVVKGSPVQNDLTMEDLRGAGMVEEVGAVMTTGAANPGVVFSEASEEFRSAFAAADMIFAKGMGYYEALSELPVSGRVFCCLVAKCGAVARSLEVPLGSYVAVLR